MDTDDADNRPNAASRPPFLCRGCQERRAPKPGYLCPACGLEAILRLRRARARNRNVRRAQPAETERAAHERPGPADDAFLDIFGLLWFAVRLLFGLLRFAVRFAVRLLRWFAARSPQFWHRVNVVNLIVILVSFLIWLFFSALGLLLDV